MSPLRLFLAGAVFGATLVAVVGLLIWPRPPLRGPDDPGARPTAEDALRKELARSQAEAAAIRARLEDALARERTTARSHAASRPDEAGSPRRATHDRKALAERQARAEAVLARLEADPDLEAAFNRHSREENAFPHWRPEQFLADPHLNPRGIELDEPAHERFVLLQARAHQRIRVLDLERQLAMAEAIAGKIEERLEEEGAARADEGSAAEGALKVEVPGGAGVEVVLTREEFPELYLLYQERKAAEVDWLLEALEFLGQG